MNAFYKRRETVSRCNPLSAYWYYKNLLPDTIDCFDPIAKDKLRKVVNNSPDAVEEPDNSEKDYLMYDAMQPVATLNVSLLRADGSDTGYGSGINWGIR
ncbi:hypothetical protein [Ruminococcus sp.]|nr:hypothetical protein [Ruminococcus sp.]